MNRTLRGPLTPARARLIQMALGHSNMTPPDAVLEKASEDRLSFDQSVDYVMAEAVQYIHDMDFRCAIIDRQLPRQRVMDIVCLALKMGGITECLYSDNRSIEMDGVKTDVIPTDFDKMKENRSKVLVVDLDMCNAYESMAYRMYEKVIIVGSKAHQYSLFTYDPINAVSQSLYPGVFEAEEHQNIQQIGFKKAMSGLYPVSSLAEPIEE